MPQGKEHDLKFTKHTSKKRRARAVNPGLHKQLQELLAQAKSEAEKQYILKAYDISLRP